MNVFIVIIALIKKIVLFPKCCFWFGRDFFNYWVDWLWLDFTGWGIHLYVGRFGSGKTSSMVHDAYLLCKKYPQLTLLTNLKIINFPSHTKIVKLHTANDILNAPRNTLVLIDEIGTIFNSRDFTKSKESVPKILFQYICQCRKRKLMIYSTTQRWNFLDKQLRDITATVRVCSMSFTYRFNRLASVKHYDADEYDVAYSNPLLPLPLRGYTVYVQSDKFRQLYDTEELIEDMMNMEYLSDEEILANQSGCSVNEIAVVGDKKQIRKLKRKHAI